MLNALRVLAAICAVNALSALAQSAPATTPAAVQGFHSAYEMRYSALRADVTIDLQPAGAPNEYNYEVSTKTRGIARIIRPGTATEVARFTFTGNGFQPLSYQLEDGTASAENDSTIQFDWPNSVARSVHETVPAELKISAGMLDRLTADIAAIQKLRTGEPLTGFDLVDRNELRRIEYTLQGEETLTVPAGTFKSLKYLRQRPGSSRATLLWFAPDAAYLPVKMVQLKRGKAVIEMLATKLEPATTAPAKTPER